MVTAEIIARAKWGDRDALAEIFREHRPAVIRYLNGVAIAHAEDVASQVWLDVAFSDRCTCGGERLLAETGRRTLRSWVPRRSCCRSGG